MPETAAAKKAAAARKTVDHQKVHDAERVVADRLEAERQQRIEERDNPPAVHLAWSNVMADVRGLGKHQEHNSPGARFNFRGIDAVMNAIGPALRQHRVTIVPTAAKAERRDVTTSGGKPSRETTVEVTYTIIGPAGDTISGTVLGEAMDNGDKGTAKAMSVAYRVFLLQALTLPTDETDPDAEAFQREKEPSKAESAAASLGRVQTTDQLETVVAWAQERNLLGESVPGPNGQILLSELVEVHRTRVKDLEERLAKSVGTGEQQEGTQS